MRTKFENLDRQAWVMNRIHRCEQTLAVLKTAEETYGFPNDAPAYKTVREDVELLQREFRVNLEQLKEEFNHLSK